MGTQKDTHVAWGSWLLLMFPQMMWVLKKIPTTHGKARVRGGGKEEEGEGTQKDTHINCLGRTIWGVLVEPFAMQTLGMLSKAVRKAHSGERGYSLRAKRKYSERKRHYSGWGIKGIRGIRGTWGWLSSRYKKTPLRPLKPLRPFLFCSIGATPITIY